MLTKEGPNSSLFYFYNFQSRRKKRVRVLSQKYQSLLNQIVSDWYMWQLWNQFLWPGECSTQMASGMSFVLYLSVSFPRAPGAESGEVDTLKGLPEGERIKAG